MLRSAASFLLGVGGAILLAGAAAADTGDFAAPQSGFAPGLEVVGIRDIQTLLKDRGYDPGPATGALNDATTRAIIAYQRDYGLDQDGVAGPRVQNALHFMRGRAQARGLVERRFVAREYFQRQFTQGYIQRGQAGFPPPTADGRMVYVPPAPPPPPAAPQFSAIAPTSPPPAAAESAAIPPALAQTQPTTPQDPAPLTATLPPPLPAAPEIAAIPPAPPSPPDAAESAAIPPALAQATPMTPPDPAPLAAILQPPVPEAAPEADAPMIASLPPPIPEAAPEAAAPAVAALPPSIADTAPAAADAAASGAAAAALAGQAAAPDGTAPEETATDTTTASPVPPTPAPPPVAALAGEAPPLEALPQGEVVAMLMPPPPPAPRDKHVDRVVPPPAPPPAVASVTPPPLPAPPVIAKPSKHAAHAKTTSTATASATGTTVPMGKLGPLDPKPIPSPRTAVASGPIPKNQAAAQVAPPTPAAVAGDAALAPGDEAVREAQLYLQQLGFYHGDADGVLNWPTVDALVKFDASGAGPHEVIADAGHLDSVWLARLKSAAAAKGGASPPP